MKLLFKQRIFSWLDSYDIYNEQGERVNTVKGELAWGHCLKIMDQYGQNVGTVKEKVMSFLPKFELYLQDRYLGCVQKEFTFLKPKFSIDFNGWSVQGNVWEWDYEIQDQTGRAVALINKEVFSLSDTYVMEIDRPENALYVLMLVLAIDAEKCSSQS